MIYLASRYERKDEMHEKANILKNLGFKVCSKWHSIPPDFENAATIDINECDIIIMFTEDRQNLPKENSGGRHFELGYAWHKWLTLGTPKVYIIGTIENAFHLLPGIRQFSSWEDFLTHMEKTDENSGIRPSS